MSHASSRAGRKRARELTWEEVLVEIENPPALPKWATPELFCALNAADQDSFLALFGLSSHKITLLKRLDDCVQGKPLPAPSDMTWKNVPRILEGTMPKRSTRKAGEMGTVEDTVLEVLRGVFTHNFRNVTEMEAVMRVGVVVLCAVKELDVTVQLQPNHPTFTDFLFVFKSIDQAICFIEVKKIEEFTSLTAQTAATAQALREAQIILNSPMQGTRPLPFLLTNSQLWSFGVAEKRSSKIAVTSIVEMHCTLEDVMEWKTIIQTVRAFIKGDLF